MSDTCQNTSIQVSLSLIFPLILIRLARGLKQIYWKNESNMSIFSNFRTKIWLKSYWRATEKIFGHLILRRVKALVDRAGLINFFQHMEINEVCVAPCILEHFAFFLLCAYFFNISFFEKFIQEYHQSFKQF